MQFYGKVIFYVLSTYYLLDCVVGKKDCQVEWYERVSCRDVEIETQSACEEKANCCWDETYVGIPKCFRITVNESFVHQTTLSQDKVEKTPSTSSSSSDSTIAIKNMFGTNYYREPFWPYNYHVSVTNVGSRDENLNNLFNVETLDFDEIERAGSNQTMQEWVDIFDRLVENYKHKLTEQAENFLNFTTRAILGSSSEENSFVAVNSFEKFAVVLTKSLLMNNEDDDLSNKNESSISNYRYGDLEVMACLQGADLKGCELTAEDLSFTPVTSERAFVTSVVYPYTSSMKISNLNYTGEDGTHKVTVASSLCSITVHNDSKHVSFEQIEMTFRKHQKSVQNAAVSCSFIDDAHWSERGCGVMEDNETHTKCRCNHNTTFAVIFLHTDLQFTEEEEVFFEIVTYVGCGTSITALLVTMFSFMLLKLLKKKRVMLHFNLSLCLCMGQMVLITGLHVEVGSAQCKIVAVLLHFFFMSAFSWMLMEGILLYFQSVRAVKTQANFNLVIGFGWLLPIINVAISLIANFDGYGTTNGCWLSLEKGFIWAFIGPATGIIFINILLLASIVRVFLNLKSNSRKGEWQKIRRSVKAIALLTPLMGLSWIFGILAFNDDTKWFLYIFAVMNSFQGVVIFILHCSRNDDVRRAVMKKYKKSFSSSSASFFSFGSSTVSPSSSDTSFNKLSSISQSTSTQSNWTVD